MAAEHRNTKPARRNPQPSETMKFKLELAKTMQWILSYDSKSSQPLSRSQRLVLGDVSRRTGLSAKAMTRRAVDNWIATEAPVYLSARRA